MACTEFEMLEFQKVKRLLLETARIACSSGSSSNRVEALLVKVGHTMDYEVEAAALPTVVWISIRKGDQQSVELARVKSWGVDLNKISLLSYIVDQISEKNMSIDDAHAKILSIQSCKPPYNHFMTFLAGGASSAAIMYFYHGGILEIALAFPAGFLGQVLQTYANVRETRWVIADFITGSSVALYSIAASKIFPSIDPPLLIVSGIIVQVPGLVFVNALHEVAQKNLASGTARILEAAIIGLSLAFGVAFALGLASIFWVTKV